MDAGLRAGSEARAGTAPGPWDAVSAAMAAAAIAVPLAPLNTPVPNVRTS
ncbi:hypothetical protein [Streptomyces sp. NPDC048710]